MNDEKKPPEAAKGTGGYPPITAPVLNEPCHISNQIKTVERHHPANRLPPKVRISRQQLMLIAVGRRQCDIGELSYRELLFIADGVSSTKDLSPEGVDRVIAGLKKVGFEPRPVAQKLGERDGMATLKQLHRLKQLWFLWLGRDDELALGRWMQKRYGIAAPRFATVEHAQKAIQGLIAMIDRKHSKSGAKSTRSEP
jgi:Protein of unknown function (DUF1018)